LNYTRHFATPFDYHSGISTAQQFLEGSKISTRRDSFPYYYLLIA